MSVTSAVEHLVARTVDLSDADMGRPWAWGVYDEEGLRFALLMTHHELRDLAIRLAAQSDHRSQAQAILRQYHQAYRDMTGALAPARDEDMDRAPAPGEWPIREVAKHIIEAEYGFLGIARFAVERHRAGRAEEPADEEWAVFRGPYAQERERASGAIAIADARGLRGAFFEIHARVLRELEDVVDDELEKPSWFWDGPMPIRFRLHRFEEHLRQHTVQMDKTLVGIDRAPTEAHRLIRNIYNALADVESEHVPAEDLRARSERAIEERAAAL